MTLSNWGKYPNIECDYRSFATDDELREIIKGSDKQIARGLGRCYGDSALSELVISSLRLNRFLSFNETTGLLTCEAGVSLAEIIQYFLPYGWFLPVTPGTKFVTVGGAIASDVHGKNHHAEGCFSDHIISMDIMTADGSVITCSKTENSDLFFATAGGMGLTGIILRASFKLKKVESIYIKEDIIRARNLDEIFEIFENSQEFTYSVAWIDCLAKGSKQGRSIMMRGEHASAEEVKNKDPLKVKKIGTKTVPVDFPNLALNKLSIKAFNFLYFNKAPSKPKHHITDYHTFFYPLDAINDWNRIYGKRGFTQYQFVLPKESSRIGMKTILNEIAMSGQGSFLAVFKLFGKSNNSMLGFPIEGYNLALDFAIKPLLFPLLERLDRMVAFYGGRIYLTKDVRMSKDIFYQGYDRIDEFLRIRDKYDPNRKFASFQSNRVGI